MVQRVVYYMLKPSSKTPISPKKKEEKLMSKTANMCGFNASKRKFIHSFT